MEQTFFIRAFFRAFPRSARDKASISRWELQAAVSDNGVSRHVPAFTASWHAFYLADESPGHASSVFNVSRRQSDLRAGTVRRESPKADWRIVMIEVMPRSAIYFPRLARGQTAFARVSIESQGEARDDETNRKFIRELKGGILVDLRARWIDSERVVNDSVKVTHDSVSIVHLSPFLFLSGRKWTDTLLTAVWLTD